MCVDQPARHERSAGNFDHCRIGVTNGIRGHGIYRVISHQNIKGCLQFVESLQNNAGICKENIRHVSTCARLPAACSPQPLKKASRSWLTRPLWVETKAVRRDFIRDPL